jgi:hypothetical protein
MIAFVTLLLGLISGVYPIEVAVGGPVTAVEFTLDGAPVGRLNGPPWTARVDLGADLRPHQLVARALDAEGKEIAHAAQWLNLPRPPAEVAIVVEKDGAGVPKAARLTWQSVNGVKPSAISLTLDGLPLTVDPTGKAELPARDLTSLHVLAAELSFPLGLTARADAVYGGEYGSDVSTELTAVPVQLAPGGALPAPEQLKGWFTAGGQGASAVAVEEGPGKVTVVCLPAGNEILDKMEPARKRGVTFPSLRNEMLLGPEDRLQYMSLSSIPFHASRIPSDLFQISPPLAPADGGLFYLLTHRRLVGESAERQRRIADSVAVAGLQATAENHRRAVLLVLGRELTDSSRYDPAAVRRYLETIHVPLFVWSLYGPDTRLAKAWGRTEDISSLAKLEKAVERLRTQLDGQRIVWLEGRHLPQSIALGPAASGVALVERAP